jgi:hypothetical protein
MFVGLDLGMNLQLRDRVMAVLTSASREPKKKFATHFSSIVLGRHQAFCSAGFSAEALSIWRASHFTSFFIAGFLWGCPDRLAELKYSKHGWSRS